MIAIPAVDIKGGRCVRLTQGKRDFEVVYGEDPVAIARHWESEGAQWLHVVDLDGAFIGHPVHLPLVRDIADALDIPVQLGGGVRTHEDITRCLDAKVDRVTIGTKALEEPAWLAAACKKHPGRIAASIDAVEGKVATKAWTEVSEKDPVELARELEQVGIACIVFTDISKDGTLSGANIGAIGKLADAVSIPVIAAGGISSMKDVEQLKELPIEGFIVGKALYTKALSLTKVIDFLAE
jgi:phosphoribosylformimino-5-aminoimidazole carboxamide ribotide isomerase